MPLNRSLLLLLLPLNLLVNCEEFDSITTFSTQIRENVTTTPTSSLETTTPEILTTNELFSQTSSPLNDTKNNSELTTTGILSTTDVFEQDVFSTTVKTNGIFAQSDTVSTTNFSPENYTESATETTIELLSIIDIFAKELDSTNEIFAPSDTVSASTFSPKDDNESGPETTTEILAQSFLPQNDTKNGSKLATTGILLTTEVFEQEVFTTTLKTNEIFAQSDNVATTTFSPEKGTESAPETTTEMLSTNKILAESFSLQNNTKNSSKLFTTTGILSTTDVFEQEVFSTTLKTIEIFAHSDNVATTTFSTEKDTESGPETTTEILSTNEILAQSFSPPNDTKNSYKLLTTTGILTTSDVFEQEVFSTTLKTNEIFAQSDNVATTSFSPEKGTESGPETTTEKLLTNEILEQSFSPQKNTKNTSELRTIGILTTTEVFEQEVISTTLTNEIFAQSDNVATTTFSPEKGTESAPETTTEMLSTNEILAKSFSPQNDAKNSYKLSTKTGILSTTDVFEQEVFSTTLKTIEIFAQSDNVATTTFSPKNDTESGHETTTEILLTNEILEQYFLPQNDTKINSELTTTEILATTDVFEQEAFSTTLKTNEIFAQSDNVVTTTFSLEKDTESGPETTSETLSTNEILAQSDNVATTTFSPENDTESGPETTTEILLTNEILAQSFSPQNDTKNNFELRTTGILTTTEVFEQEVISTTLKTNEIFTQSDNVANTTFSLEKDTESGLETTTETLSTNEILAQSDNVATTTFSPENDTESGPETTTETLSTNEILAQSDNVATTTFSPENDTESGPETTTEILSTNEILAQSFSPQNDTKNNSELTTTGILTTDVFQQEVFSTTLKTTEIFAQSDIVSTTTFSSESSPETTTVLLPKIDIFVQELHSTNEIFTQFDTVSTTTLSPKNDTENISPESSTSEILSTIDVFAQKLFSPSEDYSQTITEEVLSGEATKAPTDGTVWPTSGTTTTERLLIVTPFKQQIDHISNYSEPFLIITGVQALELTTEGVGDMATAAPKEDYTTTEIAASINVPCNKSDESSLEIVTNELDKFVERITQETTTALSATTNEDSHTTENRALIATENETISPGGVIYSTTARDWSKAAGIFSTSAQNSELSASTSTRSSDNGFIAAIQEEDKWAATLASDELPEITSLPDKAAPETSTPLLREELVTIKDETALSWGDSSTSSTTIGNSTPALEIESGTTETDRREIVEISTEINVLEIINGEAVVRKLDKSDKAFLMSLSLVKQNASEFQGNSIEDLADFVKVDEEFLASIESSHEAIKIKASDDMFEETTTAASQSTTEMHFVDKEGTVFLSEEITTSAPKQDVAQSDEIVDRITTLLPGKLHGEELSEITPERIEAVKNLVQETDSINESTSTHSNYETTMKTSTIPRMQLDASRPEGNQFRPTKENDNKIDFLTQTEDTTTTSFVLNGTTKAETSRAEEIGNNGTEPLISATINGKNVSFSAKIIQQSKAIYLPKHTHLSFDGTNAINMTWKSPNVYINNSLSLQINGFPQSVQLNLFKDGQLHRHKFVAHEAIGNKSGEVWLDDDVCVHFSNTDFLNKDQHAINEPDALPSNQSSRSLTAEILGACIGFSVIIGVLVYYSVRAYRGKTRNFKPNEEA